MPNVAKAPILNREARGVGRRGNRGRFWDTFILLVNFAVLRSYPKCTTFKKMPKADDQAVCFNIVIK